MISVAICDDNREILKKIKEILMLENKKNHQNIYTKEYDSPFDFLADFDDNIFYDILLMDIEFGNEDGIEIANQIKNTYPLSHIIFVTNYSSYMREAIKVSIIDFIVKDYIDEELLPAYRKAIDHVDNMHTYQFRYGKCLVRERINDILYFSSTGKYVELHVKNGQVYQYIDKLDDVQSQLLGECGIHSFIRVHKSFLINYSYIKIWSYNEVELFNGERFRISKAYRNEVKRKYMEQTLSI